MSHGHECHMLDKNNIPIIDSFDKFRPNICILSIDKIDETIIKCIKEYPNINIYVLQDESKNNEEKIQKLNNSIGQIYTVIGYEFAIWDSLLYPYTNIEKENLHVCLNKHIPTKKSENKIRIFNNEVIDSEFYCGSIEENQKYFILRNSKIACVDQNDWYNAVACQCVIGELSKEKNYELNQKYKDNNSAVFYEKIMENEK